MIAILWLSMLLFNYIHMFKTISYKIFNYITIFQIVLVFIALINKQNNIDIVNLILFTILGLSVIVSVINEKLGFTNKYNKIISILFVSLMVCLCQFASGIITSIILLIISIASIINGFYYNDKKVRVLGLILTLFICLKVITLDSLGSNSLDRMILFFVTGIITLIISGIYIMLEKR